MQAKGVHEVLRLYRKLGKDVERSNLGVMFPYFAIMCFVLSSRFWRSATAIYKRLHRVMRHFGAQVTPRRYRG